MTLLPPGADAEDRWIDGTANNLAHPDWGAAGCPLRRDAPAAYADGVSAMPTNRPSPRAISQAVCAQAASRPNTLGLSDFVWQWGQFLDHDVSLTPTEPAEPANIEVPAGDPWFDPFNTGVKEIEFDRSMDEPGTGTGTTPREQINVVTAWIDASNVYGSDFGRAIALRTFEDGKLLMTDEGLLPFNEFGLPNANSGQLPDEELFVAGDVRANEHVGLTAMHTLFVREHNRLCEELAVSNPLWDDEQIYQRARKIVGAQMQVITYREFLPALLGPAAPAAAGAYDTNINASIANEFSAALFRVGHTMLSPVLQRFGNDNLPFPDGNLELHHAFFNPGLFTADVSNVDCLLKGLAARRQQNIDTLIDDSVRNLLFGPPGADGLDLASLNIQRGRDHGLPSYVDARAAYGLPLVTAFDEISSDPAFVQAFSNVYGSVTNVELWVGALAEDHLAGAAVGPLIAIALSNQFARLRDGDRFWYAIDPELGDIVAELESTRLSDIIRRNTAISVIQDDVFHVIPEAEITMAMRTGGAVQLQWMGMSNAMYHVERSTLLSDGSWSPMSAMMSGGNTMITVSDPTPPAPRSFYRLRQFP